MAKFPPLFRRVQFDNLEAGINIQKSQDEFEDFWRLITNKCPKCPEKTMAMRKLQEASMWFSRAISVSAFVSDEQVKESQVSSADNYEALYSPPKTKETTD